MTANEFDTRVREVLRLSLKTNVPDKGPFSREDDENWDSLKHVEMIFMLEDEFDVQFSEADLAKLDSVDAIVDLLRAGNAT